MRRPPSASLLVALAVTLVVSACAQTAPGGHVSAPTIDGAREVEVVATEFAFSPGEVVVAAGEPVNLTLRNDGRSQHDIAGRGMDLHVHAAAGTTSSTGFVPSEPGRYELYCSIPGHARQGMEMTLVVEG